jgi:putative ABC transport system permease protein
MQWSISIILIICSVILFQQLQFMQSKKLGYQKEHILYVRYFNKENYDSIKQELLQNPRIENVTATSTLPHNIGAATAGAEWNGKGEEDSFLVYFNMVENNFVETFQMDMADGKSFAEANLHSNKTGFLLNETAIRKMGIIDPVGADFSILGHTGSIIGVVKDFHFKSLHNSIEPIVMLQLPEYNSFTVVRVNSSDIKNTVQFLNETMQKFAPDTKIDFKFFDERFAKMYKAEQEMSAVLKLFTGLAIFIACLGLFGLSSYLTELRTREIGIRKVLGADIPNIIFNLSKDFTRWIIFANIIAIPVAFLILRKALQNFAYHIEINPLIFITIFASSLLLAIITFFFHTVKAALANPVKALKYE